MIKNDIEKAIQEAFISLGAGEARFVVERPASMEHGDYATNAALAAAKLLKKNPREVAETLAANLALAAVERVEVAGAGFINFFLTREAIVKEVEAAAMQKEWGSNSLYKGKTVIVEYTSPNLFKPLHIGNLIGNILGESIARLLESAGADVKRLNYPSDIGLTVAKGVWGLVKTSGDPKNIQALGAAYVAGNAAYEDGSAKAEIEEINKALYEDTDPAWSALRRIGIETSRKHLDALCERLGTTFDKEFFESESGPLGREIVKNNTGIVFEESEGAVVYKGEQDGLHTRVFLNSQGLPTYEAKEVGLFDLKYKAFPDFDRSITVTGGEQREFFNVVFAAVKKIFVKETTGKELLQLSNGFLKLTTGKMSSRLGNVITGESLLVDLQADAKEKMQGRAVKNADMVAEQIAVGAIKYVALRQGSGRDIIFDPAKSLSLEGDSGPYLQYTHTRALSLIKGAKEAGIDGGVADKYEHAQALERTLLYYPEVVAHAAEELEPHFVTTYLTELAAAFNSWYAAERIIGGEHPHYGVLLATAVEQTLAKGLQVLGIPAPEEM